MNKQELISECAEIQEIIPVDELEQYTKIEEIKACIILNDEITSTEGEIIEFCRSKLPFYKCPKYVQFFDSLPKSSTGKLLKKLIKDRLA